MASRIAGDPQVLLPVLVMSFGQLHALPPLARRPGTAPVPQPIAGRLPCTAAAVPFGTSRSRHIKARARSRARSCAATLGSKPCRWRMILRASSGSLAVDVHARQLVPAVRAHRLQFGVALQRRDGLVEAAAGGSAQAQAVPGAVELGVERQGAAERGLGLVDAGRRPRAGRPRLNQSAALRSRMRRDQRSASAIARRAGRACARRWAAARQRIGVVGPARAASRRTPLRRRRAGRAAARPSRAA